MNFGELIWREPWLAPVIMNLQNVLESRTVPTAGVTPDGRTLYYNPDFWKCLNRAERLGVQLHEVLHIAAQHDKRRGVRLREKWNIACDIAVNYKITASGYSLPKGVLQGENDAAERIYARLKTAFPHTQGQQSGISPYRNSGSSTPVLCDDLLPKNADGSTNSFDEQTAEAVENAVLLAGKGTTPLAKSFVSHSAKADWRTILQNFVKSALGDDVDYLGYEFDESGICEDILLPKPRAKICALVDESGSINDHLYIQFLGELEKMSGFADVFASGFTDGTELHAVPLKHYHRSMTGGTNVLHTYTQACEKKYDCIIILTDGYLAFPKEEPLPTVWVMPASFHRKREVIL